jgi:cellulose synthase/poly-beta-1,6-N-acetylglucosamine synthase-like glycosyltransferase
VLEVIAILGIGLVVYSYALYPLLLFFVAGLHQNLTDVRYVFGKRDRRANATGELPAVAVIFSAYNEEQHLRQRLENLLALDYPPELLDIYVGSDGSTDATNAILAQFEHPRVHAALFEANRGKASVLNDLVSRTAAPVLVFTDANTFFAPDALKMLVSHFKQPTVGGVSGELRLLTVAGNNQDGLYWRLEQFLKFLEARIGGLLGANGAIYAIRRDMWKPLAPDTICDDFCVAMNVAVRRHRLVYEPGAWAEEEAPADIADEYRRRVRIGIGNFQALFRHPEYLFSTSPGTRFAYLSHKVLRWIAPHLLTLSLIASALLAGSPGWRLFLLAQLAGYVAAAVLYLASRRCRLPSALGIPAFLFALNWGFLIASFRYVSGGYSGTWRRTRR